MKTFLGSVKLCALPLRSLTPPTEAQTCSYATADLDNYCGTGSSNRSWY